MLFLRENKMQMILVVILMIFYIISTVNLNILSDLSSGVFLTFYILVILSASVLSGGLIATQIYYKKQKDLYVEYSKKLDEFENDNKFNISFSSEVINLHQEFQEIDKKIHQLKQEK